MNELQTELLCILEEFLKVCNALDLKYYLANGSALGAEKYGGFIKWDDDMDVAMPRADYEKFCALAKEHLPKHIFIQNFRTDKQFPLFYTKLRNSNTAFIEEEVKHLDINHGIYIDIFPLDGYPDSRVSRAILKVRLKLFSLKQFCGFKGKNTLRRRVLRLLGYHQRTHKTLEQMEKAVKRFGDKTKNCCDYGDRQQKGCFPRDYYGEGRKVKFEHLEVVVPQKIDEYLTCKYGDWRSELPKDKQKSHHTAAVCDLHRSYKDYAEKTHI